MSAPPLLPNTQNPYSPNPNIPPYQFQNPQAQNLSYNQGGNPPLQSNNY